MNEFLHTIKGTPLYVWVILLYLFFVGMMAMRTRIVYLPKIFIIPLVLLSMQYKTFLSDNVLIFCFAIILSILTSFFMHKKDEIKIIKNTYSVEVLGNYNTILSLLSFFAIKYYFGYLKSADPDLFFKYSTVENIISGVFSGYFIGRALVFTHKYLKG
jgi:hypothetical protein